MTQVGLLGLGYWGKNILRNLVELGVLHTACDINPEVLNERRTDFSKIRYSNDPNALFQNDQLDAILIATPASTHYPLAKRALEAGKHVFVEKPLALNLEEAAELDLLAKENKKVLMVGHILQYHPAILKLKAMIQEGLFGEIQYLYSNRLNIGKLRVEENILWSFAPHDLSVILSIVGEMPKKVNCFGEAYINPNVYDTTLTSLEFSNNLKAHIFVSWLHPYKEQKLIVVGSESMVVFDDLTKEKLFVYPHHIRWERGKVPVAQKADFYHVPFSNEEPLWLELQHFLECVSMEKEPRTNAEEALEVLSVLERAESSLKQTRQETPLLSCY